MDELSGMNGRRKSERTATKFGLGKGGCSVGCLPSAARVGKMFQGQKRGVKDHAIHERTGESELDTERMTR